MTLLLTCPWRQSTTTEYLLLVPNLHWIPPSFFSGFGLVFLFSIFYYFGFPFSLVV
ncbi:hypothetical protein BDV25DRAFT_155312 [Aspergillus avenaceus]|uniref:Uncharacterized protein n=1 Tax=Aspergillus avenaceus TaxID=36643 RepID=A0A5N6TUD6_ASPAV|nr:hypothetical protein BDV25DRAFT_155312 [Aspergillus avenaceus]